MENERNKTIVRIGQEMIDQAEYHGLFNEDDAKWNHAITAANKLISIGTVWGIQSVSELTDPEKQSILADTIVRENLSVREAKELIHRELPDPKKKSVLKITVHEQSIEIVFDSAEQRERLLAHLKNFY